VRPPEIWSDGERLTVEDALGRNIPPHVHYREALQAVVQVETLRDVVIDPVSFTVYALEPIERSVRPGRVKPTADFLALAFKDETAIDRALIGSTRSADNYYHWLVECMLIGPHRVVRSECY
jgi:hypothetical protein